MIEGYVFGYSSLVEQYPLPSPTELGAQTAVGAPKDLAGQIDLLKL